MPYDNTNRGILSRNQKKQSETHADYTGEINVGGVDYWLNAWVKEAGPNSKNPGKKFFSLSVKPKQPSAKQTQTQTQEPSADIPDDDVPF